MLPTATSVAARVTVTGGTIDAAANSRDVTVLGSLVRLLLESEEPPNEREALQLPTEGAAMADRVYTEPNRFHPSIHATLGAAQLANGNVPQAAASVRRAHQLLTTLKEPPPSVVNLVEKVRLRLCLKMAPGQPPC